MKTIILSANTSWYLYNFRLSTIIKLIELGYRVICLSPSDKYSSYLHDIDGCEWIRLDMDPSGNNPIKDIKLLVMLIFLYVKIKPYAVYNFTIKNNIYGALSGKLTNTTVYSNVSGLGTAYINNNIVSKVARLLYKSGLPFSDKVFVQNSDDYEIVLNNKLTKKENLILLPGSGVNTRKFVANKQVERKVDNDNFKFLYVGRMLGDKGVRELIEAGRMLERENYQFTIKLCGHTGSSNNSAISEEELAQYKDLSFVEWLGSSDDIKNIYSECDCVVLPSYREGMPRVLLEAGAMSIPCIATNVPGCKHLIIDNYNGLLCDAKSPKSLSEKMIEMIKMPHKDYLKLGNQARTNIEKYYDENIVIDKTISVLRT